MGSSQYETVFILHPKTTEEAREALLNRLKKTVEKEECFELKEWGSRTLAYPIQKQTKGVYFCFRYAASPEAIEQIERSLRLNEDVLRYLTVKVEEGVRGGPSGGGGDSKEEVSNVSA